MDTFIKGLKLRRLLRRPIDSVRAFDFGPCCYLIASSLERAIRENARRLIGYQAGLCEMIEADPKNELFITLHRAHFEKDMVVTELSAERGVIDLRDFRRFELCAVTPLRSELLLTAETSMGEEIIRLLASVFRWRRAVSAKVGGEVVTRNVGPFAETNSGFALPVSQNRDALESVDEIIREMTSGNERMGAL